MLAASNASASPPDTGPVKLSPEHLGALNRRRRIVVQFDAHSELGADFDRWLDYRFDYADEPGSQIDSLWWDIGALGYAVYPSEVLEPFEHEGLMAWRRQGIDWVARLVEESHHRGLETFWHHRISEVETVTSGVGADRRNAHPLKKAHPDWVLDTWWEHGLWNLAVPEVRQYKVAVLREVAENYDFDGIQVDFARHIPCLPPGRQWELRDCVTDLMRMLRRTLLDVEAARGRPFLLAAKVPRSIEGCRVDGFDVETWMGEDLVDILTLGTRCMDVDIEGFRLAAAGHPVKLQPCFDDHHTTDAYQHASIEFLRGVFANWWRQGADSVVAFNWSHAAPEVCHAMGARPGPDAQRQAYHEVGSPETLRLKDKVFAVDRRGGYPWAEGYFGRNDWAPLPVELADDGLAERIRIRVADDTAVEADKIDRICLRLILFGATERDTVGAQLNGVDLDRELIDPEWKDKLIRSPKPQPPSGGADSCTIDPQQRLLRIEYRVDPAVCRVGWNHVDVRVEARAGERGQAAVKLEKVEVHVHYKAGAQPI
ncbi:MAG: family 10 glycosylhydrolase [Candidatus Hydrogenedentes bacterium]|nr:family 10 glycosylhydrolase [Candidatus Hydrogenedentota bacterium]